MDSLINFDGLGEIGVCLINQLSAGIGWLATHDTPDKTAINTYIQDIQNSNYDSVTKAALISNAKKILKEYCNQKDIVQIALCSIEQESTPTTMNEDWIAQFMDRARLVNSMDFKVIWGHILAQEYNEPGAIPLILLDTLSKLDREDAEHFTSLCRLSVKMDNEYAPIVIQSRFDDYKQYGIDLDALVSLKSLGLIETSLGAFDSGYTMKPDGITRVTYHGLEYIDPANHDIRVGNVIFTKSGQALCRAIEVEKIDAFWEDFCLPYWQAYKSTFKFAE